MIPKGKKFYYIVFGVIFLIVLFFFIYDLLYKNCVNYYIVENARLCGATIDLIQQYKLPIYEFPLFIKNNKKINNTIEVENNILKIGRAHV